MLKKTIKRMVGIKEEKRPAKNEVIADVAICALESKMLQIKERSSIPSGDADHIKIPKTMIQETGRLCSNVGWFRINDMEWYGKLAHFPAGFKVNADRWNAIWGYAEKNSKLPLHKHPQNERIFVLQGKMREIISGTVIDDKTLTSMEIKGDTWHEFVIEEHCIYIVVFSPPIKFVAEEEDQLLHMHEAVPKNGI